MTKLQKAIALLIAFAIGFFSTSKKIDKISNWYNNNGREYIIENPNHKNMQPWGDIESEPEKQPLTATEARRERKIVEVTEATTDFIINQGGENVYQEEYRPYLDVNGKWCIGHGTPLPVASNIQPEDGTVYYVGWWHNGIEDFYEFDDLVIYNAQARYLVWHEVYVRVKIIADVWGDAFLNMPMPYKVVISESAFNEGVTCFKIKQNYTVNGKTYKPSKVFKLMRNKASKAEICKELLNIEKPTKGFQRRKGMQCRLIKNQL